ncbi:FAD-dependent oxidoreductase [Streptomyces sp. NPDC002073]
MSHHKKHHTRPHKRQHNGPLPAADAVRDLYDYCVIGGGASGVVAATELAGAGHRVLLLEEGHPVTPGTHLRTAERTWERALATGDPARTANPWAARALGGGTMFFAAIAFRYRELDFRAHPYLSRDALPAQWPLEYEDLRACYDEIERRLGVARSDTGDPWQPPSAPARLPPHDHDDRARLIADAGTRLGLHPFPTPLAINSRPYDGRPACTKCSGCTEYACPVGAKGDVVHRVLEGARTALTVRTGARAVALTGDRPDRVDAVEWIDTATARRRTTRAHRFVLTANAVQTARLLLASSTRWAPNGLGNSSGLLGAGLSVKLSGYVGGQVDGVTGPAPGGPHSTVAFTDYYLHTDVPGMLGGIIYQANPVFGGDAGSLRLHVLAGDQPMERNRVVLARTRDEFGVPRVVMDYRIHPRDSQRLRFLAERAADILHAANVGQVRFEPTGFQRGSRHLHGTCRAGGDPRTSVTTPDGRLHDLDNVYVADAGVFPFAGGVNPVLTIQANALRIARRLAGRRPSAGSGLAAPSHPHAPTRWK